MGTVQADTVVDHIGVNTHLGFFDTPYNKFDTLVRPALKESGIRHIRGELYTNVGSNYAYYVRMRALANDGITFSMVVMNAVTPGYAANLTLLPSVYEWVSKAAIYFEGANEPNLKGIATWATTTRDSQLSLFKTVKTNAALSQVKVLGPTPWGWTAPQVGNLSGAVDYANWHTYSGGQHPEAVGPASIVDYITQAKVIYGNKPLIVTEDGYHSGMNVPTTKHRPTPEPIVARYMPRMVLTHMQCGIVKTYFYELIDTYQRGPTDPESNFGLVRGTGERKPSFNALKNLISLYGDKGSGFTPMPVTVALTGAPATVRTFTAQKRDGTVLVAIWNGVSSWDPDRRQPIPVPTVNVGLSIGKALAGAQIVAFGDDGNTTRTNVAGKPGSISIPVTDRLTVIVVPASSTNAKSVPKV